MKQLFEHVRDTILHGMPAGCLVTKGAIDFDIGDWQHKTYDNSLDIYACLRSKWTPHTINLLIVDDAAIPHGVQKFVDENHFPRNWKSIYLAYSIAIRTEKVTNELMDFLKNQPYPMNRYSNKVICGDYTIFVVDFIKNLLLY